MHTLEAKAELDLCEVQVVTRVIMSHRDKVRHLASRAIQVDPRIELVSNATQSRRCVTVAPALMDGDCAGVGGGISRHAYARSHLKHQALSRERWQLCGRDVLVAVIAVHLRAQHVCKRPCCEAQGMWALKYARGGACADPWCGCAFIHTRSANSRC